MTFAEKMLLLCPRHKHKKKWEKVGFRCICKELELAFRMGYRSVRSWKYMREGIK